MVPGQPKLTLSGDHGSGVELRLWVWVCRERAEKAAAFRVFGKGYHAIWKT